MKYKYDQDTGIVTGKRGKPIGSKNKRGYMITKVEGKFCRVHRLAFELMGVEIPDGMSVDHINHNRSDNRWSNLRLVTQQEQTKNRANVVGVYWKHKRWEACIMVDGKSIYLGRFEKYSEAIDTRKLAEVAYGFHENHGKVA